MPRRSRRTNTSAKNAEKYGPQNLGSHWRADGTPKDSYRSQTEALVVADERRRISGADLNVYLCGFCDAWHMGNKFGRET